MSRRLIRPAWAWIPPYQVILAGLGVVVGLLPLPHLHLDPDLVLAVFVPALVFEAALNLDLAAVVTMARPIGLLATAGVLISIGLVAAGVHLALGLGWPEAVLLGSILSPTDPIAVVAIVRRSGAPGRLAALLEGESLVNDGTGVAAFSAVLATISAEHVSVPALVARFLVLTVGGVLIGGLVGLAGATVVRRTRWAPAEVAVTLAVAYGSYFLAGATGASGVMAVVAAGVAMARVATWGPDTERSWARIAIVLNAALFTLIGMALPAIRVIALASAVGIAFAILTGSRLIVVHGLGFGVPARWKHLLWWGGVRGALSVALALAAATHAGVERTVPVLAYGVVAVSLLLQGTLIRPLFWAMGTRSGNAEYSL